MQNRKTILIDTGERIIPPSDEEISFVFARHRFAYEYVCQYVADCVVAVIGCGTGYGCRMLSEQARCVYGIDHDFSALRYSRVNYGAPNIMYAQMSAAALGLAARFDVVVSFQVIEHMPDLRRFVEQLKMITKAGGLIFISTPNVAKPCRSRQGSPFHQNEMNYQQFFHLINTSFSSFEILGVAYSSESPLRSAIQKLPCYRLGARLRRNSKIKKLVNRTLDLTKFRIVDLNLEKSLDLLAGCRV